MSKQEQPAIVIESDKIVLFVGMKRSIAQYENLEASEMSVVPVPEDMPEKEKRQLANDRWWELFETVDERLRIGLAIVRDRDERERREAVEQQEMNQDAAPATPELWRQERGVQGASTPVLPPFAGTLGQEPKAPERAAYRGRAYAVGPATAMGIVDGQLKLFAEGGPTWGIASAGNPSWLKGQPKARLAELGTDRVGAGVVVEFPTPHFAVFEVDPVNTTNAGNPKQKLVAVFTLEELDAYASSLNTE